MKKLILSVCLAFAWFQDAQAQLFNLSRLNENASSVQADSDSYHVSMSSDGRYVVFASDATNLDPADTNGTTDVFLYDRTGMTIQRISVNALSIEGNGASYSPVISADGAYVAFVSEANNLDLTVTDSNSNADIFLYNRIGDSVIRVSADTGGNSANGASYNPSISSDGSYVAFQSDASDLVLADTNNLSDIFVYTRSGATIDRISLSSSSGNTNGVSAVPAISGTGQYVVFASTASNIAPTGGISNYQIYLYDSMASAPGLSIITTEPSSGNVGNSDSYFPAISQNGSVIAFASDATNLVAGSTAGVFNIYTYVSGTISNVSVDLSGNPVPSGTSFMPSLSSNGRYVSFISNASALVPNDTNSAYDAFVYDRTTGQQTRVSTDSSGSQGNADNLQIALAAGRNDLALVTAATNIITPDANNQSSDVIAIDDGCTTSSLVEATCGCWAADIDGDTTFDCQDGCPNDSAKTAAGVCGCGISDVDTDGDSTPDCTDACPSDINKSSSAGVCGCGVADTDLSGNGVLDCLDPTNSTIPLSPRGRTRGRTSTITIPSQFVGSFTYTVKIRCNGRVIRTLSSTRRSLRVNNITCRTGLADATYRLADNSVTSRFSAPGCFRVARR